MSIQRPGYSINEVGADWTDEVFYSFHLEEDIRDKWWQIKEGDVVLDIGAGYGSYTFDAISKGANLVVAFEPAKEEFFVLYSNLLSNNFLSKCIVFNCLAGEIPGICENYYPKSHSTRPEGRPESRYILTVDNIVSNLALSRVDWIKIDVEGMELDVIKGSLETIKKFKPRIIIENHTDFVSVKEQEELRELLYWMRYSEENIKRSGRNEDWSLWTPSQKSKEELFSGVLSA